MRNIVCAAMAACLLLSACLPGSLPPRAQVSAALVQPTPEPPPVAQPPGDFPNAPTGAIEQKYFADGPWAVTAVENFACCDRWGNAFDVWYPTDLGKDGFRHPVITWGNGTVAGPQDYAYLLKHWASWGFIVIATQLDATHTGEEILDGARFVVDADADPASIFHGKVAVGRVGAAGHSQGAAGAMLALIKSEGLISVVIPVERPGQNECTTDGDCPSTATIPAGASVFFINGSDSGLSKSTQSDDCVKDGAENELSNDCFYRMTPETVTKAWGTLIGPNHNDVQGQPDCSSQSLPAQLLFCRNGVYGFLGYPTAWMMAWLQDDALARSAFAPEGEFFGQDANWENQVSNVR